MEITKFGGRIYKELVKTRLLLIYLDWFIYASDKRFLKDNTVQANDNVLNSQITVGVKHQPINQRMHESINLAFMIKNV